MANALLGIYNGYTQRKEIGAQLNCGTRHLRACSRPTQTKTLEVVNLCADVLILT